MQRNIDIVQGIMVKKDKLNSILDHFDQISILVIGDLMLDRFIYGNASRISPEAPVPLIDVATEVFRLGGAANAVNNIRVLGGKVIAVGVVGDDWFGKRLTGLLKEDGIDTTGINSISTWNPKVSSAKHYSEACRPSTMPLNS
jgi:bifunctional ADP-heptose synthase (sugar kinase/adenylyltransferase)